MNLYAILGPQRRRVGEENVFPINRRIREEMRKKIKGGSGGNNQYFVF